MSAMTCGFNSRPVHHFYGHAAQSIHTSRKTKGASCFRLRRERKCSFYVLPTVKSGFIMNVVIASRNAHKIREITTIFRCPSVDFVGLDDFPGAPEVEEDGKTFQANAVKKALSIALFTRHWTLADDSGLEVDALDGSPGVLSARYAGEHVSYEDNNSKLLEALKGHTNRAARFRCVIALASPRGRTQVVEGVCEGVIIDELRGKGGFGYDPLFAPKGYARTFAEMDPSTKNDISHRALALKLAREAWLQVFEQSSQDWPTRSSGARLRPFPTD